MLYTIGFTRKGAEPFFGLLEHNGVARILDVRLNNRSQLAGFTRAPDFAFFLQRVAGIDYIHIPELAPTRALLDDYRHGRLSWRDYEARYTALLVERDPSSALPLELLDNGCLLCSEPEPDHCHRRLAAEHQAKCWPGLRIRHLG